MRLSATVLLALLATSACGPSSVEPKDKNQQVASICISMVEADPAARVDQLQSGMLAKTCDCYAETVAGFDPAQEQTHLAVWEALQALKAETGMTGIEALGVEMMTRINAAPDTYAFSASEFSQVGRFVGEFGNQVEATGDCPRG